MNMYIGRVYNAAQAKVQLSFKPTIDKAEIFVDTHNSRNWWEIVWLPDIFAL